MYPRRCSHRKEKEPIGFDRILARPYVTHIHIPFALERAGAALLLLRPWSELVPNFRGQRATLLCNGLLLFCFFSRLHIFGEREHKGIASKSRVGELLEYGKCICR